MIIKTKFDVDDKVWRIDPYHCTARYTTRTWNVAGKETIADGKFYLGDRPATYTTNKCNVARPEYFFFKTRKLAQAECDKRNDDNRQ